MKLKSKIYFLIPTKAFTLVELIVVITILAILWTIWFVSYTWFMSTARDSNRLTQLEWIHNWLETYKTRWKLPLPDDSVTIYASWTIIWYQWNAWETVLNKIWYQKWWKDPLDDKYYTYYTDKKQQNIELLGFLENDPGASKETTFRHSEFISGSIIQWYTTKQYIKDSETSSEWRIFLFLPKTYATDYTERIIATFWKKLWILLDTNNNPIQENTNLKTTWLDIVTTTWSYSAVFTDKDKISWTWFVLQVIQWTSIAGSIWNSCKDYLDKSKSLLWKDWIYQIKQSSSTWSFSVYYDMTTDWDGWILVSTTLAANNLHYTDLQVWSTPILLTDFNINTKKLSDDNINLLRWNFDTSIIRVDSPWKYTTYFKDSKRFWWKYCWTQWLESLYFSYTDAMNKINIFSTTQSWVWHHCWWNIRLEWIYAARFIYSSPSWNWSPQWYLTSWYEHWPIKMWVK